METIQTMLKKYLLLDKGGHRIGQRGLASIGFFVLSYTSVYTKNTCLKRK